MKKIAISQSNYIPWRGYFDLIASVDEFVLYDDAQYTKRDWRNRNQIKTPQGLLWLSIPVQVKNKFHQKICETFVNESQWRLKHWKTITQNYKKAPFYEEISDLLEPCFLSKQTEILSEINYDFIRTICDYLEIKTNIISSNKFNFSEGKSEKLLSICLQAEAQEYVSAPAAKNYLDESIFINKNISVSWHDYENYLSYQQLWGEFIPNVSIIDLLFNCGKCSNNYLKYC